MARNELDRLLDKLEGGVLYFFKVGIKNTAENIVKDLQEQGPTWSGRFGNSWEIASASKVSSGSGALGVAQPIEAPLLSNDEFKFKPEVKYYIANKAAHADYALDLKEGKFKPEGEPLADRKIVRSGSRPNADHKRGAVISGDGSATSSAELDWYITYLNGGKIDKTVSLYMDQALRNVKL
jgi:hypothetical protein